MQPNAIVGMSLTMNKYVLAMIFVFNVIPFALITIVYLIIILMLWSPKVISRGNVDAKMQVQATGEETTKRPQDGPRH